MATYSQPLFRRSAIPNLAESVRLTSLITEAALAKVIQIGRVRRAGGASMKVKLNTSVRLRRLVTGSPVEATLWT